MRSTQVRLKNPLDVVKSKPRSPLTNKIGHKMINLIPKNKPMIPYIPQKARLGGLTDVPPELDATKPGGEDPTPTLQRAASS
jgi:hypothetical protein